MVSVVLLLLSFVSDWTATADTLAKSVVPVENKDGACTGMIINAKWKGDKDLFLTCAHCYGQELFADSATAKVVMLDKKHDLMVLEVDDTERPAVTFALKNPHQGEDVASFGYGMALERPMLRIAHVSDDAMVLPDVEGGPFIAIDAAFVGGQSGGAVVNTKGEIVSIVQRGTDRMGIGIGVEAIRSKISRYLEKPIKP